MLLIEEIIMSLEVSGVIAGGTPGILKYMISALFFLVLINNNEKNSTYCTFLF